MKSRCRGRGPIAAITTHCRQVTRSGRICGADGVRGLFHVEHHFLDEYSHCPAPEVLYGAIAQRTKKMRIGHGVRLLPFPYNHPVRAAEQAAVLDPLCDGRLDFGTGRSTSRP
jgi:alkanesulfonate monooxygenase SsuD/methylene tetrahydromethanopterin reductase-like flavin-dependent oxidoreductase (luciferase family)